MNNSRFLNYIFRILSLILAVSLVLSCLTGCGKDKKQESMVSAPNNIEIVENNDEKSTIQEYADEGSMEEVPPDSSVSSAIIETLDSDMESNVTPDTSNIQDDSSAQNLIGTDSDINSEPTDIQSNNTSSLDTNSSLGTVISNSSTMKNLNETNSTSSSSSYSEKEIVNERSDENLDSNDNKKETDIASMEDSANGLTETQRNSINMLNYLTALSQEINKSKGSRMFIENVISSLINNTYPNAVDIRTQAHVENMLDTLVKYRMIDVQRERLEYRYDQNRAQALRGAIPNPVGLLSAVKSESMLKAAASVIFMAVDSVTSYTASQEQAKTQNIEETWQLDDEELTTLDNSRTQAFSYMTSMVRDNHLPGDYALNEKAVEDFADWQNKDNAVSRLGWFESKQTQEIYKEFGPYWLRLVRYYYEAGKYDKCIESIRKYEEVSTRILRYDYEYAEVIPFVIASAKETCETTDDYIKIAREYAEKIVKNTTDSDWALRYFAAQAYIDIYTCGNKKDKAVLERAYEIIYDNVNKLSTQQISLNEQYLADIKKESIPKGSSKRVEKEIKKYNNDIENERKTALPPINNALYLNCDLLLVIADECKLSEEKRTELDAILHENDERLFLVKQFDNRIWFSKDAPQIVEKDIQIDFTGKKLIIPVIYVSDQNIIRVSVKNTSGTVVIDDWSVDKVNRHKKSDISMFVAEFVSPEASKIKYQAGDEIHIEILPIVEETEDVTLNFYYKVVGSKIVGFIPDTKFERINK